MNYLKSLLDLIYPRLCIVCRRVLSEEEGHFCRECHEDIPLTYYWSWRENPSEKILWGRTYFERVVSLFIYKRESDYKKAIHRIKYHDDTALALYLGKVLGEYMRDVKEDSFSDIIDYIIPVPLHPYKKWRRGYNQAEIIARGISEGLWCDKSEGKKGRKKIWRERIITNVLFRKRATPSQTIITMGSKWENVANAFEIKRGERLRGKHILLVDDVLTSGATAEACYNKLSHIENLKVSFASLSYVEQNV